MLSLGWDTELALPEQIPRQDPGHDPPPMPANPAMQCHRCPPTRPRIPAAPEGKGQASSLTVWQWWPQLHLVHCLSHLVDLLPAVLIHAAQPGVVVQQELTAVGITPDHGAVVQGCQPSAVLVVWGGTQVQQRLQEKRLHCPAAPGSHTGQPTL